MADQNRFPDIIDIRPFDEGFVVKLDEFSTYYQYLEDLARAIYPSVRHELNREEPCAGSC